MKNFYILFFLIFFSKAYSNELIKTLTSAFENNSKINAERASLNAAKQDINISRGNFLPSVTLSGDMASQENSGRTNQNPFRAGL